MDIVLGVSMAPTTVRMVLLDGENSDGGTVDEDGFEVTATDEPTIRSASEQVISAILGTRESAAEGHYHLTATGVTWTDPEEAAALRDALADHKVENVMLVSAFVAAAALAQSMGSAAGYARTGLLFLEPDTATLAIVDSANGSILEMRRQPLDASDPEPELTGLVAEFDALDSPPNGVFVVGAGVDIDRIKPRLEAATTLPVTVPDEPATALARGAALASANAPLFISSTAALAYSQVPDWTAGALVDAYAGDADFTELRVEAEPSGPLAYEDAADDEAYTEVGADIGGDDHDRRPFFAALSVMSIFFIGVLALVISLAISVRPVVSQQPRSGQGLIIPAQPAPAPAPNAQVQAPPAPPASLPQPVPEVQEAPENAVPPAPAPESSAPAPAATVPAPAPAVHTAVPVPVAAAPAPPAPPPPAAPAPDQLAPAPAAPPPVPAPVAPAPVPVPVPVPVAPVFPLFPPPVLNPFPHKPPFQPGGGSRWEPAEEPGEGGWPRGGGGLPGGGWPGGGNRGGGGLLPGGGLGGGGLPGGPGGFGGNHGGFGGGPGGFGGGHGGFGGGHFGR